MIRYAPAKINLGLQITGKRADGYHDLQSLMVPVGLCDILECKVSDRWQDGIRFHQTGISLEEGAPVNLCIQAYDLLAQETPLPPVEVHLHKQIPWGAGLGGGSSDASATLAALNTLAAEPVTPESLVRLAAGLGSDCPFFLQQDPMMMEGRGEILTPFFLELRDLFLVLLFPGIHISTAEAYGGVTPRVPERHLKELLRLPMPSWRGTVVNAFEESVFRSYPKLGDLKDELYASGALYASMSGSGSALFGIFRQRVDLPPRLDELVIWKGPAEPVPCGK